MQIGKKMGQVVSGTNKAPESSEDSIPESYRDRINDRRAAKRGRVTSDGGKARVTLTSCSDLQGFEREAKRNPPERVSDCAT